MTEKEWCEYLNKLADARVRIEAQQKFLDELNEFGEIRSKEEFLRMVKIEDRKT